MARNSTTFGPGNPHARRGNGAGWGGPAKGAGVAPGTPSPGRPAGEAWAGKATVADLMIEAGAQKIAADAWLAILNDPAHPKHAEMLAKAAERMDGAPVQRQDITSNGERIGYVIPAPPEAESAEAWAEQHKPR